MNYVTIWAIITCFINTLNGSSDQSFSPMSREFTDEYAPTKTMQNQQLQLPIQSNSVLDFMLDDSDDDNTPPPLTPEFVMKSLNTKIEDLKEELRQLKRNQQKETEWIEAVRIRLKNVFERLSGLEYLLKDLLQKNKTTMIKSPNIPYWDNFSPDNFTS